MFGRTRSVLGKLLKDLNGVRKKFNYLMQILMLCLSAYNLINTSIILFKSFSDFNFKYEWYLILRPLIFLLMFSLSLYWFIYSLNFSIKKIEDKELKEKRNKMGDTIKYIKMGFRPVLLGYTLIDYIINSGTILSLVLCITSIASYLFQILLTIITKWFEGYIELIQVAIEEDVKPITNFIEKASKTKEAITNPLYSISKAIAKKADDISEEETIDEDKQKQIEYVNELNENRIQKAKEKKNSKLENFKNLRKEVIDNLGSNIKKIFQNKKKNKEDE